MNNYEILGLNPDANTDEIKSAYKKLAKKYHPDINKEPGAEEKFKQINEAYQNLINPKHQNNGFHSATSFYDFLNQQYNQGYELDCQVDLVLDFIEAATGCVKDISYKREAPCDSCQGRGKSGTKIQCYMCSGSGMITNVQMHGNMRFQSSSPCVTCFGTGYDYSNKCQPCSGNGSIEKDELLKDIKIPAGVINQTSSILRGAGNCHKGKVGNLIIQIYVRKHESLARDEQGNIYSKETLKLKDLIDGTTINVNTIFGPYVCDIPKMSKPGDKIPLKNMGINNANHIIELTINYPNTFSQEQIEALNILNI